MSEDAVTTSRRFSFPPETTYPLLNGDCWRLATALNQRTGYGYSAIYGDDVIQHVGLTLPNGNIVDIEGVWQPIDWENHWIEELAGVENVYWDIPTEDDPEYFYELNDHDPASEEVFYGSVRLREIADKILKLV